MVFIILLSCLKLSAQSKNLEKANAYFNQLKYTKALEIYLEIENQLSNPREIGQLKLKMATCYYKLHQPVYSLENFEKALLFELEFTPEQNIDYVRSLIETGNYDEAKNILENTGYGYVENLLLKKCEFALKNHVVFKNIKLYKLHELPAIPIFGITYYRDSLLYIFNEEQRKLKSGPGYFGYLGGHDKTIIELSKIDFPQNSNSPVISNRGDKIFFCTNASFLKTIEKGRIDDYIGIGGIDNLFIFCQKISSKKQIPKKLPFNHIDFSCTHPCLSKDGNTLYFASNMLGGYGEFDIYTVKKTESGWDTPQNIGNKVNTFLNEGYPYLEGEYLFFSSEGLPGYGGMDIFKYDLKNKELVNLGKPLNSSFDDFYYIKNGTEGYFVSNRSNGYAKDIIYKYIEK